MEIDTTRWSGEGTFTQALVDRLRGVAEVAAVRVEDAPSSRFDADYTFISNEIFLTFRPHRRRGAAGWLDFWHATRGAGPRAMTIEGLAGVLGALEGIGPADFVDQGMIQYLRTERIVPPYQTRGFKLVEMVRLYEAGSPRRP